MIEIVSETPLGAKTIAIEKVAEHLGVSGWTVRAWIRAGFLSSHKVGRRVLLIESEVRELLARTHRPATRGVVAGLNGSTTKARQKATRSKGKQ